MTALTASLPRAPATLAAPWSDAALRATFAASLVVAPLPLGCAGAEARAWCCTALGALALLVAIAGWHHRSSLKLPPAALPLLLFATVPLVQLLPIGAGPVPALLGDLVPSHPSLVPVRTWTRLGELVAFFGCYASAALLLTHARHARVVLGTCLLLASGLVVYGVLAEQGLLPLVSAEQTRTVLVATFVNRNHLANLLGMAALAGLGLFFALRSRRAPAAQLVLVGSGIGTAYLGIVASQSRGGLVALAAGALAFTLLAVRAHGRRRSLGVLALCVGLAGLVWMLPAGYASRFVAVGNELQADGTRTDIWRGALGLWQAFPWLGTGLGTFGDLSPATQSAAVPGRVEHAHSDPLELLVETGLCGTFLLVVAGLAFAVPMVRRCLAHDDRERALLAAGGLAALTATAVHSCVEFHLQIPANAAWTATMAGLVVGMLRSRRTGPAPRHHALVLVTIGMLAVVGGVVRATTHAAQDGLLAIDRGRALLPTDPAGAAAHAALALQQNPFSPRAHRLAGEAQQASDPAAAQAAFGRCVQWTNPAERPQRRLELAIGCLVAGDPQQTARWLGELLPQQTTAQQFAALDALYAALPAAEVLLGLLPQAPTTVRATFTEVLLHRGDFAGRELVLANLRGEADAALLTVNDDVRLVATAAPTTVTDEGAAAAIAVTFARAAGAAAAPLVLRCEGPGAAIYRSFAADADTFAYTARFDRAFPPGTYTLSLDFRADAPHFPFGTVTIDAQDLDLRRADLVPATQLYWTTADPGRRIHPEHGLPLRRGDFAWRRVLLPDAPCDLVLRTQLASRLAVTFDERDVPAANSAAMTVHRFALPKATMGTLSIRSATEDEPLLRELFVTTRSHR